MSERLLLQHGNGFVVQDVAGLVDQAVLSMAGIRIERDVRDDADLWEASLHFANAARHQAIRVEGLFGLE